MVRTEVMLDRVDSWAEKIQFRKKILCALLGMYILILPHPTSGGRPCEETVTPMDKRYLTKFIYLPGLCHCRMFMISRRNGSCSTGRDMFGPNCPLGTAGRPFEIASYEFLGGRQFGLSQSGNLRFKRWN
ncbi:hypothetical protein L211DRAFT_312497 [Terfezia boudieri ATCC MYA-4762]|uniref:Uncharacterized protein n=1 Tax=Terfezia boudieri ATCC MYA-4762 TaxID=1051890 RepID=A0A3N4LNP6_9PEZI|nr:hypothetical protein L211DRAFT_312497 [Terfezia boudieri ATCC MYA-4762]